jgi:hypothetical protein
MPAPGTPSIRPTAISSAMTIRISGSSLSMEHPPPLCDHPLCREGAHSADGVASLSLSHFWSLKDSGEGGAAAEFIRIAEDAEEDAGDGLVVDFGALGSLSCGVGLPEIAGDQDAAGSEDGAEDGAEDERSGEEFGDVFRDEADALEVAADGDALGAKGSGGGGNCRDRGEERFTHAVSRQAE